MIDASGTIAAGGTAQTLFNVREMSVGLRGFWVQNLDASETLYINDSGEASITDGKSIAIPPSHNPDDPAGGLYETPDFWPASSAPLSVSIVAATTGHKFSARGY